MDFSINHLPKDKDRNHMAARILDLTLEIIYLITGEVRVSRDIALISINNTGK